MLLMLLIELCLDLAYIYLLICLNKTGVLNVATHEMAFDVPQILKS